MDYFFMIEFNQQRANAAVLMQNIKDLGCKIKYLSADMSGKGVLGVVESPTLPQRDRFFDNVSYFVQKINGLSDGPYGGDGGDSDETEGLATWAYTTIGDLVHGLRRLEAEDGEDETNLYRYKIDTVLWGGVTGVHGG